MDTPREAILGDRLHQDAQTILQKSFDFARSEASVLKLLEIPETTISPAKANEPHNGREQLSKAADDENAQIADLRSQLARSDLTPEQRGQMTGKFKLAQARQSLLQTMLGIIGSENDGTLLDQIDTLSHTAIAETPNQSKSSVTDTLQTKSSQASYGIFGLSEELLTVSQKQDSIKALLGRTQKLAETTHTFISSLRQELKDALSQGDALTANSGSAADLVAYQKSIDGVVEHYKQLTSTVIPLGESNALLQNTIRNLQEWKRMIGVSEERLTHRLLIRLIILLVTIAVPPYLLFDGAPGDLPPEGHPKTQTTRSRASYFAHCFPHPCHTCQFHDGIWIVSNLRRISHRRSCCWLANSAGFNGRAFVILWTLRHSCRRSHSSGRCDRGSSPNGNVATLYA